MEEFKMHTFVYTGMFKVGTVYRYNYQSLEPGVEGFSFKKKLSYGRVGTIIKVPVTSTAIRHAQVSVVGFHDNKEEVLKWQLESEVIELHKKHTTKYKKLTSKNLIEEQLEPIRKLYNENYRDRSEILSLIINYITK